MEFNTGKSRKAASFKIFTVAFAVYPHLGWGHQIHSLFAALVKHLMSKGKKAFGHLVSTKRGVGLHALVCS